MYFSQSISNLSIHDPLLNKTIILNIALLEAFHVGSILSTVCIPKGGQYQTMRFIFLQHRIFNRPTRQRRHNTMVISTPTTLISFSPSNTNTKKQPFEHIYYDISKKDLFLFVDNNSPTYAYEIFLWHHFRVVLSTPF